MAKTLSKEQIIEAIKKLSVGDKVEVAKETAALISIDEREAEKTISDANELLKVIRGGDTTGQSEK